MWKTSCHFRNQKKVNIILASYISFPASYHFLADQTKIQEEQVHQGGISSETYETADILATEKKMLDADACLAYGQEV